MPQRQFIRFLLLGTMAGAMLTLTSCGFLPDALPNEERYRYINEANEKLAPHETGVVLSETYDDGDGVFTPSTLEIRVEGPEAFEQLSVRVKELAQQDCTTTETFVKCISGRPQMRLSGNSDGATLNLMDRLGGRDGEVKQK